MKKILLEELQNIIEEDFTETEILSGKPILIEPNLEDVEKRFNGTKLKVIKNIIYDKKENVIYEGKYDKYNVDPQNAENIKFVKKEILPMLKKEKEKIKVNGHNEISENDKYLYEHKVGLIESNSHNILDECLRANEFLTNRENALKDMLKKMK